MNHKNCHARSKQKRKALRLKNLLNAIYKRTIERMKPEPRKGRTYTGKGIAKKVAIPYSDIFPSGDGYGGLYFSGTTHGRNLNQRQKRKRMRQQPHGK